MLKQVNPCEKILHIIEHDKFTNGYINFMELEMNEYDHSYITFSGKCEMTITKNIVDTAHVIYASSPLELLYKRKLRKILNDSDRIIVSGVFRIGNYLSLFPKDVLNKMSLHFWGGDFYSLNEYTTVKQKIRRVLKKRAIARCKNVVFLIEGEEKKFADITGINKDYYIAPMPGDPNECYDYSQYYSNVDNHIILVGNSASPSNHHDEVFKWLSRYKDIYQDMKIVCPLSYGDNEYRNYVIEIGKEIFGDSFQPILDYMLAEEYNTFLSNCTYGIFNNDRQQAMGNINIMLYMGKKVFMRTDTSMWDAYRNRGFTVYPAELIKSMESEAFFQIDEEVKFHNQDIGKRYIDNLWEIIKESWKRVFES